MDFSRLKQFVADNKLPVIALAASVAALLWFAGSFILDVIYFNDPRHQDEALKGWMTPRYVAMSYDLPGSVVEDALQLTLNGSRPPHLDEIARDQGVLIADLDRRVREAAAAHRRTLP